MIFAGKDVFVPIDLFERCGEIASVGIIVDFSEDKEKYIVGAPADIKAWAFGGCPQKALRGFMRHSNNVGNLVKYINRLMKVKYELNEIMEINNRLCNTDALCDGSCNAVLEELSQYPKLLKKYNKTFDDRREKIRVIKRVLTTKSSTNDIDRYHQMCFDACQD